MTENEYTALMEKYDKRTLMAMSSKVVRHLARKYENMRKGVDEIMGGRVLDYEAKDILNRGRTEGREEGKAEGRAEGKAESVIDLLMDSGFVASDLKDRIISEKNLDTLNRWLKLAAKSDSIEDFIRAM